MKQRSLGAERLHSIPEVEEESDGVNGAGHQHPSFQDGRRPGTPHAQRRKHPGDDRGGGQGSGKTCHLRRQRSTPRFADYRYYYAADHDLGRPNRQNTKSPDSGLDCGSEEEGSLGYYAHGSAAQGHVRVIHCEGPVERRALAMGRRRTLTRQCSVEEEFSDDLAAAAAKSERTGDFRIRRHLGTQSYRRDAARSEGRLNELEPAYHGPSREAKAQSMSRLDRDQQLVCDPAPSLSLPC